MAEIAVVHMDLMSKGGGEAVSMNVLEALQDDHDVSLLTLTDPDFAELNRYFNTAVNGVTVERAGVLAPFINQQFGLKYYILQNALLGRYARRHADDYDLLVSTINELGLGRDHVQYIHFPFDWSVNLENRDDIFHPSVADDSVYERLCTLVGEVDVDELRSNVLLANSPWTASVVEEAYGVKPRILYPPVDTTRFTDRPWADREPGFVTIGRVERSKRIRELIQIIDGMRDRGHDTHLHVIGPTVDENYRQEVTEMADNRDYIFMEGEVSREQLVDLVCSHRYGIHGKEFEHFGMAVAELAAGGTIPFVPATGGQHVVVDDREELLYEDVEDAVDKIDYVFSDEASQRRLRTSTADVTRRFGRDQFKEQVRELVDAQLDRPTTSVPQSPVSAGSGQTVSED